ncbi:MAG: hypothetical protein HON85_06340, partial [Euryarchaeota archaeon]|nr:hypothetical protein [Euryarchaeota archaeon]
GGDGPNRNSGGNRGGDRRGGDGPNRNSGGNRGGDRRGGNRAKSDGRKSTFRS